MNLRTVILTATTAAVLATSGVAIAGATGNSTPGTTTQPAATAPAAAPAAVRPHAEARRARRLARRALIRRGAAEVIMKTIGIDRPTLRSGLAAGQTIGQIATAHGSTPEAVIAALVTAAKTRIETAVTNHKITAERAAKIEGKLEARVTKIVNSWHPKRLRNASGS